MNIKHTIKTTKPLFIIVMVLLAFFSPQMVSAIVPEDTADLTTDCLHTDASETECLLGDELSDEDPSDTADSSGGSSSGGSSSGGSSSGGSSSGGSSSGGSSSGGSSSGGSGFSIPLAQEAPVDLQSSNDLDELFNQTKTPEAKTYIEEVLQPLVDTFEYPLAFCLDTFANCPDEIKVDRKNLTNEQEIAYSQWVADVTSETIVVPDNFLKEVTDLNAVISGGLFGLSHHKRQHTKTGKSSVWIEGDVGNSDNSSTLSLGGIGIGRKFNDHFYSAIGFGRKKYDAKLSGDTNVDLKGNYYFLDLQLKLTDKKAPLWLSVMGISTNDETTITRNANSINPSVGKNKPKSQVIKARLNWDDLYKTEKLKISPYISYTYEKTKIGAYTEVGGNLPIALNDITREKQSALIGLEGKHTVNNSLNVFGSLDLSTVLRDKTSNISGVIASTLDFSQAEVVNKGDKKAHARIGINKKIGKGILSTSLNASKADNEDPTWWLNSSYSIDF